MRKNATSTCAVLLALLATAGAVQAQDPISPERHQGPKDVPSLLGDATTFGLNVRFTDLNGDLDSSGTAWSDAFNSGIGLSLDLAFLNEIDKGFHMGPYFQLSADMFQADETPVVMGIPVTDVDDLLVGRLMVGLATRFTIGPIFIEARGGLGAVHYTATDVTNGPTTVEMFEGSTHFGWEGRATFGAMLGDASWLGVGFGYEANDGPNGSDDIPTFEPKQLKSLVITIGLIFQL